RARAPLTTSSSLAADTFTDKRPRQLVRSGADDSTNVEFRRAAAPLRPDVGRNIMTRTAWSTVCVLASILLFVSAAGRSPSSDVRNQAAAGLEEEIKRVEGEIDKIFADTLAQLPSIHTDAGSRMKQVQMLGKIMLFDKQLSVNRNEACTFCHMPDVDFTGPISMLNNTTVSYPGSVR